MGVYSYVLLAKALPPSLTRKATIANFLCFIFQCICPCDVLDAKVSLFLLGVCLHKLVSGCGRGQLCAAGCFGPAEHAWRAHCDGGRAGCGAAFAGQLTEAAEPRPLQCVLQGTNNVFHMPLLHASPCPPRDALNIARCEVANLLVGTVQETHVPYWAQPST
jgi:hypothetical protein